MAMGDSLDHWQPVREAGFLGVRRGARVAFAAWAILIGCGVLAPANRLFAQEGTGESSPITIESPDQQVENPLQQFATPSTPAPEDLKSWTLDDLRAGIRVEVDSRLRPDGVVEAFRITLERADDTAEVKGTISAIDLETMRIVIPPFTIQVNEDTDIDDEDENDSYDFEELQVGWHLEVDVNELPDGSLVAVEIAVDTVTDDDKIGVLEIEAFIQSRTGNTDDDNLTVRLLGQNCKIGEDTVLRIQEGVKNVRSVRPTGNVEDESLGLIHVQIGSTELIIGGEMQLGYELRDQYELDRFTNRDISTIDAQITLQAEWYLTSDLLVLLKGNSSRDEVIYDEDRDLELGEDTRITEAYVMYNIPDYPFLVQLGRQRFDDDREWFYDGELDGARVRWTSGKYSIDYSISELLRDNHLQDQFRYQLVQARYQYERKSAVTFHVIDIVDDTDADQSPFYLGLAAVGRWKGDDHVVKYWGQYAYADGVTGFDELQAHAIDFGGALQWKKAPLAPYVFASYAWAQGDDDPTDGTNEEFRQSGLEDNNDKLFGVASYRYYGELFRPELANMEIWTLGAGIRPNDHLSVDFVFHTYAQDVAANTIRSSRLRTQPDGFDTDLGMEFDVIVGLSDLWGRWDAELDFGYFIPGDAFQTNDDPATWVALQIEYKF